MENNVPFQTPLEAASTPACNQRQRPEQLTVSEEAAGAAAESGVSQNSTNELNTCDIGTTGPGVDPLTADVGLLEKPGMTHARSPSAMHAACWASKTPKIPTCHTPNPSTAAAAASKLHHQTVSVSIAAAVMLLVAAVAAAVLLPQNVPHDVPHENAWSADSLSSILPAGTHWAEVAEDIAAQLRKPAHDRSNKAPALLLACASAEDCDEAAAALAMLPPKGEACALTLESRSLQDTASGAAGQPAAALQAQLAPFIRKCPAGLVVLRGVQVMR